MIDARLRLNRLRSSHRDSEWFHAETSEIAAALRRLARAAESRKRAADRRGAE